MRSTLPIRLLVFGTFALLAYGCGLDDSKKLTQMPELSKVDRHGSRGTDDVGSEHHSRSEHGEEGHCDIPAPSHSVTEDQSQSLEHHSQEDHFSILDDDRSDVQHENRDRGRNRHRGRHGGHDDHEDHDGHRNDRCPETPGGQTNPPSSGKDPGSANGESGSNSPLHYADVEPIITKTCSSCHRSGGSADFLPLTTLGEVKAARASMVDALESGYMPLRNPDFKGSADYVKLVQWLRTGQD